MNTPQTIVIIGAGIKGQGIAAAFSAGGDRVLLCDADKDRAEVFVAGLQEKYPCYEVEAAACYYEASWEADVIILSLPPSLHGELARKVKPVACQKVVITTENNRAELEEALPHSKIVEAFSNLEAAAYCLPKAQRGKVSCTVAGRDEEAVKTVMALVGGTGFQPLRLDPAFK